MEIRIDAKWIADALPVRPRHVNKGNMGTLHILAGSSFYRGAAGLAAAGALRAGAGLVRLASTEKVCAAVAAQQPCCMLHPLQENEAGGIAANETQFKTFLAGKATAILAGSGMGNTRDTAAWVQTLLQACPCPMVLDADALNILAGHLDTGNDCGLQKTGMQLLNNATHPVILTPHIGEMARLSGLSVAAVAASQSAVALDFALAHGCVVVLKSDVTIVAAPDKSIYRNDKAGNPGMARGGSGDVLGGIIASLLAQGLRPQVAAAAGVWLHATAGDKAAEKSGIAGLSPGELPDALCAVWKELKR